MKLQDIADMKEYLENRCYCPYEIYDLTGFFFQCFKPEANCSILAKVDNEEILGIFVIAKANENAKEQIICIETKDNKVDVCWRIDATEHNKKEIIAFANKETEKMTFDEYKSGATKETLDEIMSIADAIMI